LKILSSFYESQKRHYEQYLDHIMKVSRVQNNIGHH